MPSFLKHVKVVYDPITYIADTNAVISRTFQDILAIDPTTKNAADGVVSGSPTATFLSSSVAFEITDIGKYLYIPSGTNLGLYQILVFNSATSVGVNRNFTGNDTAIPFTISSTGNLHPYYHFVTYNGQEIPYRVDEASSTFSKYWYEVNASNPASVSFSLYANPAFLDTNYSGYTPAAALAFASADVFTINYLIEV